MIRDDRAAAAGDAAMLMSLRGVSVRFGDVVGVLACGALLQVVPVNLLGVHLGDAAGVGLYTLTNSFTWPLLIAAAAYAWSAWQMWSLDKSRR